MTLSRTMSNHLQRKVCVSSVQDTAIWHNHHTFFCGMWLGGGKRLSPLSFLGTLGLPFCVWPDADRARAWC